MTVSPLDAKLYIADDKSRTIIRVKTMGSVRNLRDNFEVVAGSGQQCTPGDAERCGDGGEATSAKLYMPKGDKGVQIYQDHCTTEYIVETWKYCNVPVY